MEPGAQTDRATEADLAGAIDATADRSLLAWMRGELTEAERRARYRLIAPLAVGGRALDAGCGTAEGCAILAEGGASEVVGIDAMQTLLDAARPRMPGPVELVQGELIELPYPDGNFDLIACFDAGQYLEGGPSGPLDELFRVLAPGGVLALSAEGVRAARLKGALRSRLSNVRLLCQQARLASALLDVEFLDAEDAAGATEATVLTAPRTQLTVESRALALGSDAPLPPFSQVIALTAAVDERRWLETAERQQAVIEAQETRIAEFESTEDERRELRRRLVEAEQELAWLPDLRRRAEELERMSSSAEWRIAAALRVPRARAEGMWLPALRRRIKQLLGRLVRLTRSS